MDPQDQTFMTIHNLTPDANILFASESILDILGYQPEEVVNKSCFDYFHPDEVPLARSVHSRGVRLDKAAVLHYARIRAKDGRWVSCECCFTVVHDVLVASTSIYCGGAKSEGRAIIAPRVRRLFSSSPRDPRYHMLEHLSPKFKMAATEREPRAALVLNRFTRNLTVMFATNAVTSILGLRPDELLERPFYHCIQENCLTDAIACLESAKKNESIAYLRFFFRDPRQDDNRGSVAEDDYDDGDDDDDDMDDSSEEDDEMHQDSDLMGVDKSYVEGCDRRHRYSRNLSNAGGRMPPTPPTSTGMATPQVNQRENGLELEAVVSCTSDGLVVVLRRARPPIPDPQLPLVPAFNYENGLFAAPWSLQPIEPYYPPELLYTFRAPFLPQYMPLQEHVKAAGGPPREQLMRSIRDVAVFAWAVVGINGNLATFGHGLPGRGAQPPDGLPVWDPNVTASGYQGPEIPPPRNMPYTVDDGAPGPARPPSFPSRAPYTPDRAAPVPPHHQTTEERELADGTVRQTSPGSTGGRELGQAQVGRRVNTPVRPPHGHDGFRMISCDCPALLSCSETEPSRLQSRSCAGPGPVRPPTPPRRYFGPGNTPY